MKRIYPGVPDDLQGNPNFTNEHIILAVDPSGGGSSQFAVFSLVQFYGGQIMVKWPVS
jgi:hypothetical protein